MQKYYYGYDQFVEDTKELLVPIKKYNPEAVVSIARGGNTFGHFLASGLKRNELFSINCVHYDDTKKLNSFKISNIPDLSEYKKVLVVDDIVDSGETITEILRILKNKYPQIEFKVATLFFKGDAIIKADFTVHEAKQWIEFFWEKDIFDID